MVDADVVDEPQHHRREFLEPRGGTTRDDRVQADADHAAALGDGADHRVGLVARYINERAWVGVRDGDRARRGGDRLEAGTVADVGEVDEHADPVHLGDHVASERRETLVDRVVAGAADQVTRVVGELRDADAARVEVRHELDPVFERRGVLKAGQDADPAGRLCRFDTGAVLDQHSDISVRLDKGAQPLQRGARLDGPLPNGARRVDRIDAASTALQQDLAVPVVDLEAIDDRGRHATPP